MSEILEQARKLRAHIENLSSGMEDSAALEAIQLFPSWDKTNTYAVADRVQYNGILYKCLQKHTAQESWNPIDASSLWAKVLIPSENEIPDWEQPDSTNAYSIGDKVKYNGSIYESLIDNNVWSPEAYPAGWQLVE